jgi:hypothetical protein
MNRLAAAENIDVDPAFAGILKNALNNTLGADKPPHVGLIDNLKGVVRQNFQEQHGLIKRDMENITQAWDQCAKESKLSLMSAIECRDKWNSEHTKASSDPTGTQKYHTSDIKQLRKNGFLDANVRKPRRSISRNQMICQLGCLGHRIIRQWLNPVPQLAGPQLQRLMDLASEYPQTLQIIKLPVQFLEKNEGPMRRRIWFHLLPNPNPKRLKVSRRLQTLNITLKVALVGSRLWQ